MHDVKRSWHEDQPPEFPITQVYGLLFDALGRILSIELDGTYTLSGGKHASATRQRHPPAAIARNA